MTDTVVTLESFAAKARDIGKAEQVTAVLELVENQLFEVMDEMRSKGIHFVAERRTIVRDSIKPESQVTAGASIFDGKNQETRELRNIAQSLVRMLTAQLTLSEEDKKIIGNAAFDDVMSAMVEGHDAESSLGIHHKIFAQS
jgi:hypothetical protein